MIKKENKNGLVLRCSYNEKQIIEDALKIFIRKTESEEGKFLLQSLCKTTSLSKNEIKELQLELFENEL